MRFDVFKTLKYRFITFLVICVLFSLKALAVEFYSVNSIHGISIRVTNSICKDNNGFIWASSKTGILRLTDDDYRIYHLPYEKTGVITVKLIYENSKLTAFTNNGQIFLYNSVFDRFDLSVNLNNILNIDNINLHSLLIDNSGDYWIALNTELYKYRAGKLQLIDEAVKERRLLTWYDQQHLIIAKTDGLWLLDTQSLQSKCLYKNEDKSQFYLSSLFFDKSQNKLWMGTYSNGLLCFSFNSETVSPILKSTLPRQPILAITENSDSNLLIGIDGQGIWELNKNGDAVLNVYKESADDPNSLRGNGVYDIYCDQGKRVWIGTISGGVSFYDQASPLVTQVAHRINNSNTLANSDVSSILEDRSGKIWFATNNGISSWDTISNKWKNFYCNKLEQAQVFLTLCEDDRGRIWAGSYSSGVYVLDEKTGQELAHYSREDKRIPTISNFVFDIFKDSQGDLWIGGIDGEIICYLSKENKFKTYSYEPISSFAELSPNEILLGCSYGILLLNKQTGEKKNLVSDIVIQNLLVLGEDVWIATSGEGLWVYNYKSGIIKKYGTELGLPSNFINSIAYADNYLWLGTEGGLCRFDPKDKTALTFSSLFPLSSISYNKSAIYTLRNGKLAWGTNNGAIFFVPKLLKEISSKGRIFFQDLTVSGRSIRDISTIKLNTPVDSLKNIDLKYFQNTISVELLPIGVSSGAKFSWKMEGFDTDWVPPTSNRIITYTNIPSGKYTLKVKLLDNSTTHIISERSMVIHLIPPLWRTGWFWTLIIIIMVGVILLYLLYYINKLKQKHAEEKVRFFTNTAHEIRTSLTLIKAPVEELSKETNLTESGKYYLNLAIEQARRLSSVVTQLMDFQKADIEKEQLSLSMTDIVSLISNRRSMFDSLARTNNIELLFNSDRDSYITAVDESKMEKIIDNLISNAIKYSHSDSQIQIDLTCTDKKWILQVKDTGIGISLKAQHQLFKEFYRGDNAINSKVVGSGIGLLLVQNYVRLHGGTISLSSQENIGSTFQVVIPFKEVSKNAKTVGPKLSSESDFPAKKLIDGRNSAIPSNQFPKEMSVLIVEDNEDLRNFMLTTFSPKFTVFTAEDGIKAWEIIRNQIPDMVVSDVMMPNMDGFELCKLMKSTYETSHIPIILLTALSEKTEQLHGLGLGADDYLTKPFDMSLLMERIKSIIRNRKVIKEIALKLIKGEATEPIQENGLNDKFVKRMLNVVWVNISNVEFDKDKFASAMNVSSSLLYKKIKLLTDQSPRDFIKTIRLNHAMELLHSQKYTVTEVSELCGFSSLTYFGIVFRKQFGKSPSEVLE